MDGQGPEHSCGRIERYLLMLNDDPRIIPESDEKHIRVIQDANFQVCNPSFAANYFHLLKRQLRRDFRKPLIVSSPKRLLRLKQACSDIIEFNEKLKFSLVREEKDPKITKNSKGVKTLIICSGQVYYDIVARREKLNRNVRN